MVFCGIWLAQIILCVFCFDCTCKSFVPLHLAIVLSVFWLSFAPMVALTFWQTLFVPNILCRHFWLSKSCETLVCCMYKYEKRNVWNTCQGDRITSQQFKIILLVRFALVCINVSFFNDCNLHLTCKLLQQGYIYHKLFKTFTKFYNRYKDLVQK